VAEILREHVLPMLAQHRYDLPPDCPLALSRDVYAVHEANRALDRSRYHKCLMCGKMFVSEKYLDDHFDRRHSVNLTQNAVCLADYCSMLSCEPLNPKLCRPAEMERSRATCDHVIHRCFPPEKGKLQLKLHDIFTAEYCDKLDCGHQAAPAAPPPSRARVTLYYVFVGFVAVGLVLFYIALYVNRSEGSGKSDLARLSSARHTSRLNFFFNRSKKKTY